MSLQVQPGAGMVNEMATSVFDPFFTGSRFPLYSCLSRAPTRTRRTSVLLCSPWGDEYLRFHRAFRQLALLLNDAGFHVLRFDWTGCGDSAGEAADWSLTAWRQDVLVAAEALGQRVGAGPLAVLGLRLGATLAALASPELPALHALVLWDPVVDGSAYLQEARHLQRIMLSRAHALASPPGRPALHADGSVEECLGFPLPPLLCQQLEALHLSVPASGPRRLWINTRQDASRADLPGTAADNRFDLPSPDLWTWREAMAHTVVPRMVLERIVSWLAETCP